MNATQPTLTLPAFLPFGSAEKLAQVKNPLTARYDTYFERLGFVAECQARFNASERVPELEAALRELIDTQHDDGDMQEVARVTCTEHQHRVFQGGHTPTALFERLEVLKSNYRDLTDAQKYSHSQRLDAFKRRVFDVARPDDDYPGLASFFDGRGHEGNDNEEEEEEVMTYHTKRSLKCPLTMMTFREPMRSRVCVHIFERAAVEEMLARNRGVIDCPVAGCPAQLTRLHLERDRVTERRVREEQDAENETDEEGRDVEALDDSEAGDADVLDVL